MLQYAIALTGGIATGKSSTIALLSLYGFRFIDADKIAHEHLDNEHEAIASMFGEEMVNAGKIDRKKLGALIFNDVTKRRELEELLHPLIYDTIMAKALEQEKFKTPYMVDIPLFFETSRYPIRRSIVVYATKQQQLQRLMSREGYTRNEALCRIEAQMDIEQKRSLATYVIDNSGDLKQLQEECERVKQQILDDFRGER
ncbi:MAG TPA: dephospho-CoA kinase [Epsilonproteobacteria bacterium]|nr:dephospho-CoA kinase [Campylobacterota bacterium]